MIWSLPRYHVTSGCGEPENVTSNLKPLPSAMVMSSKPWWISGFSSAVNYKKIIFSLLSKHLYNEKARLMIINNGDAFNEFGSERTKLKYAIRVNSNLNTLVKKIFTD